MRNRENHSFHKVARAIWWKDRRSGFCSQTPGASLDKSFSL
jgi:hypothetical protein